MKLQVGTQTIKNILNLFDTSKDNQISLGEFEKQLGPFLGSAATGRVQALTVDKIQSKVISEDMKKELVAEMRQEQKKKVQYEDFSLKPAVDAKQVRQKELLIV
jgi:Ca2+-binding EF-hand superfamily protein